MAKTTKPRNDWDAIRLDVVNMVANNMTYRDIANKYNTDASNVQKKAKKEGWLNEKKLVEAHEELAIGCAKIIEENIKTRPDLLDLQAKVHSTVLPNQIEQVNKDIASMALYKANLMRLQQKFTKVIEKSADQVDRIIDSCVDGLYTTSLKSDGTATYDRTTRFLSDLSPFFAENNKALGLTTAQVAIQNNVGGRGDGSGGDDNIKISENVVDASRDYQEFIKSK